MKLFKGMRKEITALIAGAFGLVVALVWRDAIMAWLEPVISSGSGAAALTFIAIVVTVIALFSVVFLKKLFVVR